MRRIKLLSFEMTVAGTDGKDIKIPFVYRDSLLSAIEQMPEGGFGVADMEKRLRIRKKLIEAGDEVLLDNDDYNTLLGCVEKQRFRILDDVIARYFKDIKEVKNE